MWDEAEFDASVGLAAVQGIEQSLAGAAGTWPALLPRLRARAKLARDELTSRLAAALGVADRKRKKVHRYYHQMEVGTLPAEGVSQRVLDALGQILGESGQALRRAGEGTIAPAAPASSTAYARTTFASDADAEAAGPALRNVEAEPDRFRDEVDELFRAGHF